MLGLFCKEFFLDMGILNEIVIEINKIKCYNQLAKLYKYRKKRKDNKKHDK